MATQTQGPPPAAIPTPFPVPSRIKSTLLFDTPTTVSALSFSDKILLTLSQNGRLNHWIHVPLAPPPTTTTLPTLPSALDPSNSLLPSTPLTATTLLGGTLPTLDTLGQTLAVSLATALTTQNPNEGRMLVLGLGLERKVVEGVLTGRGGGDGGVEAFAEVVGLCLDVL